MILIDSVSDQSGGLVLDPLPTRHHRIVIIGGGTAGITVAAQLASALDRPDIAIIEPSDKHYYQPLWTLVGGGVVAPEQTVRDEADYIPRGVTWLRDAAAELLPADNLVITRDGMAISYDYLVVAPGIRIDWDAIEGLAGNVGRNGIVSNYGYDLAPQTWEALRNFRGGTAIFTQPSTPIKCGGAPQKILYLADDHLRRAGVRDRSRLIFASAGASIFGIPEYRRTLDAIIDRKGIETWFRHELIAVRPATREAVFRKLDSDEEVVIGYDLLHVTPPMSAPDFIKRSPLAYADGPNQGWLKVDIHTLQHTDYPNVFGLGDVAALPTGKTGAAIRKQAPVVVHNLMALLQGEEATTGFVQYDGYSSCPLVTGYGKLVLAEFKYDGKLAPTFPFDQTKERLSMYLLKRYMLPPMYWHGMLRGRA